MRDIVVQRTLLAPRAAVWAALTDRDSLEAWLMPNDFEPRVGHQFTFRTKPAPGFDGIVHCKVLVMEPMNRLVISWRGGPLDTTVHFELADHPKGTTLSLRHEGFSGVSSFVPRIFLGLGWRKLLSKKLPSLLNVAAHDR